MIFMRVGYGFFVLNNPLHTYTNTSYSYDSYIAKDKLAYADSFDIISIRICT